MKRSRFTEEQIIGIIKEHENGLPASDICRKHGISSASFYKYKAKFGHSQTSFACLAVQREWMYQMPAN